MKISAEEVIKRFQQAGYSLQDLTQESISGDMMLVAHYFRWCLAKYAKLDQERIGAILKRDRTAICRSLKVVGGLLQLRKSGAFDPSIELITELEKEIGIAELQ